MFHHQLWEGALGLEHHSKHGLTQALQDLLESGDIFSNPLSIKKGHDSSPFPWLMIKLAKVISHCPSSCWTWLHHSWISGQGQAPSLDPDRYMSRARG